MEARLDLGGYLWSGARIALNVACRRPPARAAASMDRALQVALKEAKMRFNSGLSLAAAAVLGSGAAARGDDLKSADKENQKVEAQKNETGKAEDSNAASTSKHRQGKKRAGKRQQLRRGAGPVGDEGTRSAQPSGMKPELSPDTGLQSTAEHPKAGKDQQLPRGAGPTGAEGTAGGKSGEAPAPTQNPSGKGTSSSSPDMSKPEQGKQQ
jgi:hypothetical protein